MILRDILEGSSQKVQGESLGAYSLGHSKHYLVLPLLPSLFTRPLLALEPQKNYLLAADPSSESQASTTNSKTHPNFWDVKLWKYLNLRIMKYDNLWEEKAKFLSEQSDNKDRHLTPK